MGDNRPGDNKVTYKASSSKLYYDSLEVMGWDFKDTGFKVLFSKDIPTLIYEHIREDIDNFLAAQGLIFEDFIYFIFHPGGKIVLDAYTVAFILVGDSLLHSREVMNIYGNMSSVTVLYVLDKFM